MRAVSKQSTEETENAAKMLMEFWEKGFQSWASMERLKKKDPSAYVYGNMQEVLVSEAARFGLNRDTMQKAWRAAKEYSKKDIKAICSEIRDCNARFGLSHFMRALAIENRDERDRMIQKAIAFGWGVTELERAIQVVNGPREYVGRKPKIPGGEKGLLADLFALTTRWERWCEAARIRIPSDLNPLVRKATLAVGKVRADVEIRLAKKSPKPSS